MEQSTSVVGEDLLTSQDVGVNRDEAIAYCKSDLNFFASVCLPEVYKFPFAPLYLAIWQLLIKGIVSPEGAMKLALGLPRGFAKTLLLKLLVIYAVMFTDRQFILVICNTATLAENFIADVADTLSSPNILRLFGDWRLGLEKDTQELKKFTFKGRGIILAGLGTGSSLRGLNLKYMRPDIILMDDMQSREESESPAESAKQLTWMLGTLMKANNKVRCLFVFLGNMYPTEGCILKKLRVNPGWTSLITGAILEDGESLWPELRSISSLLEELEDDLSMGHPEIFFSEVMNDDEAGSRSTLDFSQLNIWDTAVTDAAGNPSQPEGGWVIIDPSLAKVASDETAIGVFYLFDGEPVLWHVEVGKFDEKTKIELMIRLLLKFKLTVAIIEAVAYQGSLCFWFDFFKARLGLHAIKVLPIDPKGVSKNSRIMAAAKQLTAKAKGSRLWLHPGVRSQVVHQFLYWNPLKTKNKDDVLDLLAYAYPLLVLYGSLLLSPWELLLQNDTEAAFSEDLALAF